MDIKVTNWTYLEPFLSTKDSLHLREISSIMNRAHSGVRKHLDYFEKEGILVKEEKGNLSLYRLNLENPLIIDYLSVAEKEKLVNRCRKDLLMKEIILFLHRMIYGKTLIIFGSSTENLKKASDIDLVIVGKVNFRDEKNNFEKKFNIKLHIVNVDNLKEINVALKEEIRKKHLAVQNVEEFVKWIIS